MKLKTLFLTAVAGTVLAAPAHALFVDLEGLAVDGAGPNSLLVPNLDPNEVIDVTFNFEYEAGTCDICGDPPGSGNPSWGEELLLSLNHIPSGTAAQIGTDTGGSCSGFGMTNFCEFDLGWDGSSGIFSASGSLTFTPAILDGSGLWAIIVLDSFDDAGVDGVFLAGSFVSINQAAPVPVPATLLLIGLGLVGVGVARRRRA